MASLSWHPERVLCVHKQAVRCVSANPTVCCLCADHRSNVEFLLQVNQSNSELGRVPSLDFSRYCGSCQDYWRLVSQVSGTPINQVLQSSLTTFNLPQTTGLESSRANRTDLNCPTLERSFQDPSLLDQSRSQRAYQYPLSRHRDNIATLRQELQTINSDISRVLHEIRQDPLLARHSHSWYPDTSTANDRNPARSEGNQQSATADSDPPVASSRAAEAAASLRLYQSMPERARQIHTRQQMQNAHSSQGLNPMRVAPLISEASMSSSRPSAWQPRNYRPSAMDPSTISSDTEMQTVDDSHRPMAQGHASVMNPDFFTPPAPVHQNIYHNGHTTVSSTGPYASGPFVVSGGPPWVTYGHMSQHNPYAPQEHHPPTDYRHSPYPNIFAPAPPVAPPSAVAPAQGPMPNPEQDTVTNRRRSRSSERQQETEPTRRIPPTFSHYYGFRSFDNNPSFSHAGVQTTAAPNNPYQHPMTAASRDGTTNHSNRMRLNSRHTARRYAFSAPQSVPHQDVDMRDPPHGLDDDPERPEPKENLTIKDVNLECKVCLSQMVDSVCLPCGHVCMCRWCVPQALPTIDHPSPRERRKATCPICREVVKQTLRIYLS